MDRGHNEGEIHQNGHFSFQFLSGGCWPKTVEAEETRLGKLIIGISGHSRILWKLEIFTYIAHTKY